MDWRTRPPPPAAWGVSSAAAPTGATEPNLEARQGRPRAGRGELGRIRAGRQGGDSGPLSLPPPRGHQAASVQSLRDLPPSLSKLCFSVKPQPVWWHAPSPASPRSRCPAPFAWGCSLGNAAETLADHTGPPVTCPQPTAPPSQSPQSLLQTLPAERAPGSGLHGGDRALECVTWGRHSCLFCTFPSAVTKSVYKSSQ